MKAVIIACPEVKSQGVLAGQEFSQIDDCQGQVFCDRSYLAVTLTARRCRKVLLCLVPHLKGAHLRGPGFDTRSGNILSFLLPLFQEGQLSVTGESMCTKYWLTA